MYFHKAPQGIPKPATNRQHFKMAGSVGTTVLKTIPNLTAILVVKSTVLGCFGDSPPLTKPPPSYPSCPIHWKFHRRKKLTLYHGKSFDIALESSFSHHHGLKISRFKPLSNQENIRQRNSTPAAPT